jgi:hypothetical protein
MFQLNIKFLVTLCKFQQQKYEKNICKSLGEKVPAAAIAVWKLYTPPPGPPASSARPVTNQLCPFRYTTTRGFLEQF